LDCSALDYSNQPYKVEKKIWNYNISAQDGAVIIEKIVKKLIKHGQKRKITEELLQHEKLIISFKEKKSVIINEINSRKRKKYSLKRFVPRRVCMPDQLKLTEIYNTANPLWKVPDGYIFPSNLRYFIQEMLLLMEYPNLTLLASGGCPRPQARWGKAQIGQTLYQLEPYQVKINLLPVNKRSKLFQSGA